MSFRWVPTQFLMDHRHSRVIHTLIPAWATGRAARVYDRDMAHYFSAEPEAAHQRRTITVPLAGESRQVVTDSGVFSPGHLDVGTAQLLRHASDLPATGTFVDLGCGWGPIALDMALQRPEANVVAVDINSRALALTAENARALGVEITTLDAVTAPSDPRVAQIDVLRSNPPIRIGKQALHELLTTWLPRLAPAGIAELVVAKNLGADSLAGWISSELGLDCRKVASRKGFRILQVRAC